MLYKIYQETVGRKSTDKKQTTFCCIIQVLFGQWAFFFLLADEISDVVYLIQNWNSFANQQLRSLALFFTFFFSFSLMYISLIVNVLMLVGYCSQKNGQEIKKVALEILLSPIIYLTKLYEIIFKIIRQNYQGSDPNKKDPKAAKQLQFFNWVALYLVFLNALIESGPELIIQTRNNSYTQWNGYSWFSFIFSILAILTTLVQISLAIKKLHDDYKTQTQNLTCEKIFKTEKGGYLWLVFFCMYLIGAVIGGLVTYFCAQASHYLSAIYGALAGAGFIVMTFIIVFSSALCCDGFKGMSFKFKNNQRQIKPADNNDKIENSQDFMQGGFEIFNIQ